MKALRIILRKLQGVLELLNLLETEFKKIKRQKIGLIIAGIMLLFWAGITFWAYHVPQGGFEGFYVRYGGYISMLLPFVLGLLFVKIYHAEYRNDTLKGLLQIPVTMSRLFFSKILFVFLIAVIIMIVNCLLTVASACICGVADIEVHQVVMLIKLFFLSAAGMVFAMFPVFLVTVFTSGNTIFSSTVCFVYSLMGIIGVSQFAGIHPISSLLNILFDGQISITGENSINPVCVADIIITALITTVIIEIFYRMKRTGVIRQTLF